MHRALSAPHGEALIREAKPTESSTRTISTCRDRWSETIRLVAPTTAKQGAKATARMRVRGKKGSTSPMQVRKQYQMAAKLVTLEPVNDFPSSLEICLPCGGERLRSLLPAPNRRCSTAASVCFGEGSGLLEWLGWVDRSPSACAAGLLQSGSAAFGQLQSRWRAPLKGWFGWFADCPFLALIRVKSDIRGGWAYFSEGPSTSKGTEGADLPPLPYAERYGGWHPPGPRR